MKSVDCDRYMELLSAQLDGALTESEERELEAHLSSCPACRAVRKQLAALQPAFAELEDIPAPEGFTQGVMDRVRGAGKTAPLFRRPRFKVLAGLAACAALAVGLYGVASPPRQNLVLTTRDVTQSALEVDGNVSGVADLRSVPDPSATAAGPDTDAFSDETGDSILEPQKAVPDEYEAAVYDSASSLLDDLDDLKSCTEVLVVDRMPEGGWELILPDAYGSADGLYVTGELLDQIQRLAQEQGITASITSGTEEPFLHLIVVLDETE